MCDYVQIGLLARSSNIPLNCARALSQFRTAQAVLIVSEQIPGAHHPPMVGIASLRQALVLTYAFPKRRFAAATSARPGFGHLWRVCLSCDRDGTDRAAAPKLPTRRCGARLFPKRLPHLRAARQPRELVARAANSEERLHRKWMLLQKVEHKSPAGTAVTAPHSNERSCTARLFPAEVAGSAKLRNDGCARCHDADDGIYIRF